MADRRAVGASLAAAVIFSSILTSNFLLLSGEQQRLRLVSTAAEERSLFDRALVAKSAAVLELLDRTQDALSSSRFSCSNATEAVSRVASSEKAEVEVDTVSASSTLALGPPETMYDNLTALQPFSGSVADWTNFIANVSVHGQSPGRSVALERNETHRATLPLRLAALVGTCLQDVSVLDSSLQGVGAQLCNDSVVLDLIGSASRSFSASAEAAGFIFSLSFGVSSPPPCAVSFTLGLAQESVRGPESLFSFAAEQTGTVYWPRAALQA